MTGATVTHDRPTLTADLDQAHGRLVGALSTLSADARDHHAGTIPADLDKVHGVVDALAGLLVARARDDLAGAVLSGQHYEVRISGSPVVAVDPRDPHAGTVSLTVADRAADRLRPTTHTLRGDDGQPVLDPDGNPVTVQRLEGHAIDSPTYGAVLRVLRRAAEAVEAHHGTPTMDDALGALEAAGRRLVHLYADITPSGEPCESEAWDTDGRRVSCERVAIRRGYCARCWPHVHGGFPPDAALLRDWNAQLDRDCRCTSTVCLAAGAHMPAGCLSRIPAGEPKRTCDTCTKRKWRARRDEKAAHGPLEPDPTGNDPTPHDDTTAGRATTGTGGAFAWDEPT